MMYRESMPKLDLHGMDREITRILVKEFLQDNHIMGYNEIAIIHGIGTGVLKEEVHKVLKGSLLVKSYKLDNFNSGVTLVELKSI